VAAWLARAIEFKPPGDEFPQIIQSDQYRPILAIEFFFAGLRALSTNPKAWPLNDPPDPLSFRVEPQQVVFFSGARSLSVHPGSAQVSVAGRTFTDPSTVTLFRTLHALLLALTADFSPVGALGTQYASRAYRRFTRLGFSCGPLVVELEGAHNGPAESERLYVLDLVRADDSFLWQPVGSQGSAEPR
jgi:hypothetical protein